jgi:RNA polymerase sigma factor (sigma-70 family)
MKNGLKKAVDRLRKALDPTGISDGQLLTRFIAERDEAAFAALVRRHGPMVLGVCRRILGNAHDSDDAFQATFLVLVQRARSVVNHQAIGSWLHTVACRSAQQAKVRNMRRQHRERQVDRLPHPLAPPQQPNDWQPLLDEALSRVPEKYRAPVILCDLEGVPRRDVARQLHLAEGTLSSRLSRGRRLLAQRLSRHGITLSGGALAMSLSEASARVPPSLVGMTTKAALVVAAGQTTALSTSISLIMKGATQAMFFAKLKATLATVMAIVVGAGTLVYCASGQTGATAKPQTELEALRHENELLKINLRVTLEKIRSLEGEVTALKGQQAKAAHGLQPHAVHGYQYAPLTLYYSDDLSKVLNYQLYKQPANTGIGYLLNQQLYNNMATTANQKATREANKTQPDRIERALKMLGEAKDTESRQKALDQMERVIKRLREEIRPRTENK